MDIHKRKVLETISAALWKGKIDFIVDENIFQEFEAHAIIALPAELLSSLRMTPELYKRWKNCVIQHISHYVNYIHAQRSIPLDVPYVILKGTSAGQYYRHPQYRSMGDIDIIVSHEDFEQACQELRSNGYIVRENDEDDHRHVIFYRNGIIIELHQYYAKMNDPEKAKMLDDLIIANITPEHILPDTINGLVILEHISQHLECGLGFRQIIDWMMFVDAFLTDTTWPEFKTYTDRLGLTKLALLTTQMCIKYLGLGKQTWCRQIPNTIIDTFVEYIFDCGNFGNKHTTDEDSIAYILTRNQSIFSFFRNLQKSGINNWKALKKYPFVKPFAWIYQMSRYIRKGRKANWVYSYQEAKKRSFLLDELGVRRESKGVAMYRDGMYFRK